MAKKLLEDRLVEALKARLSPTGITQVRLGEVGHYKGGELLKVSNGTPGEVLIKVCTPGRLRKIHMRASHCGDAINAVLEIAHKERVPCHVASR